MAGNDKKPGRHHCSIHEHRDSYTRCPEVPCDEFQLHPIRGGHEAILLVASCYRNWRWPLTPMSHLVSQSLGLKRPHVCSVQMGTYYQLDGILSLVLCVRFLNSPDVRGWCYTGWIIVAVVSGWAKRQKITFSVKTSKQPGLDSSQ